VSFEFLEQKQKLDAKDNSGKGDFPYTLLPKIESYDPLKHSFSIPNDPISHGPPGGYDFLELEEQEGRYNIIFSRKSRFC
jgi:hypothetical protein